MNESLIINEDIEVFVSKLSKTQVRLSVRAPREITVWRNEIVEKRKLRGEENE